MERAHRFLPVICALLLSSACGGNDDGGATPACTSNSDCGAGEVCVDGACEQPTPAETGAYSAWSDWSVCDVTCGSGSQQRTRTCQGASGELRCGACGGECSETMQCNDTSGCTYAFSGYGFYDDCSAQCGGGTETRARTCSRSDGENAECSFCGGACDQSRACNDVPGCTSHYGTWGSPSSCSSTCGAGTQSRTRSCLGASDAVVACTSCGGNCTDQIACRDFSACTYSYGDWTDFSSCSTTCGGDKTRTRACLRSDGASASCDLCGGACVEHQACPQNANSCGTPSAWTFTVSSTYSNYTGQTQSQSATSGGLADGKTTGATSVWGSNPTPAGQSIIADFGASVYVTAVRLAPIDSSFDAWGPSYSNGIRIESSADGATWTLVTTTSGVQNATVSQFAVGVVARYIRLKTDGGYMGFGELTFL